MKKILVPPCFYRIGIKVLIEDDKGKILFIQNPNKKWELPGGGIESGETLSENIKREVYEELGVEVLSIEIIPRGFTRSIHTQNGYPIANIVFGVKIQGEVVLGISDEAINFGYFSKDQYLVLDTYDNLSEFLEKSTNPAASCPLAHSSSLKRELCSLFFVSSHIVRRGMHWRSSFHNPSYLEH